MVINLISGIIMISPNSKVTITDKIISVAILPFIPSFVTPNHITAFRFASIPVVIYFFTAGNIHLGIATFIVSAFSDAVDGALARTKKQITEWGKMYDPVADKLLIGSISAIVVTKVIGKELALAIIILELLIVTFAFYRKKFKGKDISAKKVGKIKMVLQSFGLGFAMLFIVYPVPIFLTTAAYLLFAGLFFAILSLFVYRSI
ncbi:MAG: CDP-alcohol phosphatidyltransferase family protein [bacterium]|nr:CDP-alcohol phosphatidyltransferase family protein [bacterium]